MGSVGDRMKSYEDLYNIRLLGRVPIVLRLDGKGFSRYTKAMKYKKPFDECLSAGMSGAMIETAKDICGCMFGFTQSDETTFILRNDQSLETQPWFDNRIQKIVSVVASMYSVRFNALCSGIQAYFDARVFAVPNIQEAINALIHRQQDCVKNSIQCSTYYLVGEKLGRGTTRKLMEGLDQKQQQELLYKEAGINWAKDIPQHFRNGIGCYKEEVLVNGAMRTKWKLDKTLPLFAANQQFLSTKLGIQ